MADLDFQALARAALAQAPSLLAEWLPGGRQEGAEYVATNPTRADKSPGSFKVNINTGKWSDFATNDKGGDLVSLFSYLYGYGQAEAARGLAERLGLGTNAHRQLSRPATWPAPEPPAWLTIMPVPADAGRAPDSLWRGTPHNRPPDHKWPYLDQVGRLLGGVVRWDTPGQGRAKDIRPLTYCEGPDGSRAWRMQGFPEPRPLYGLDRLADNPQAPVLVVEGEKTVDTAKELFPEMVAITSPGGSNAAVKADWSPLRGRAVTIWPDADEAGSKYAHQVTILLQEIGAGLLRLVELPQDLPPSWDLADTPPEGWDINQLRALLEAAQPPEAEPANIPDWPEPVPFETHNAPTLPVDSLPAWGRNFVLAAAEQIQVSPELVLANVLGAVSACASRRFRVQVYEGYTEPVNLYLLAPAPPAERKSAAQAACLAPLFQWECDRAESMRDDIRATASRRKSQEAIISGLRGKLAKAKPEERAALLTEVEELELELEEVSRPPRLVADDITAEALAALMAANGERMAVISAEGGLFDTLGGRYQNGLPNLDLILKAHPGEPVRVDRKSGQPVMMQVPALTLCISPQPDVLANLPSKPGFRGRGLLARFVYILPESRLGRRKPQGEPLPEQVNRAYAAALHKLLDLEPGPDSDLLEHCLRLEPSAHAAWCEFSDAIEAELVDGGRFENVRDWAGKLPGLAARLAGLLHIMEHLAEAPARTISGKTMEAALNLSGALVGHALAAFGLMGADPDQEAAKKILAWIKRDGVERFTARDAHRAVRGSYPRAEQVLRGMDILEERAFIWQETAPEKRGVGRPQSPTYNVNPRLWDSGS